MSIIYDFKSIAGNLRDDRWYAPAKPEPANPLLDTHARWFASREEAVESGRVLACSWCLDLGFIEHPCFKCRKLFQ